MIKIKYRDISDPVRIDVCLHCVEGGSPLGRDEHSIGGERTAEQGVHHPVGPPGGSVARLPANGGHTCGRRCSGSAATAPRRTATPVGSQTSCASRSR